MEGNTIMYSFLLFNIALCAIATASVLDLPYCGIAEVLTDKYLSTGNSLIAKRSSARSSIECIVNCWRKFPIGCNSVFKDHKGNCYELNGDTSNIDLAATGSAVNGDFVEIMDKNEVSNCNGRTCSGNEVCMKGCGEAVLEKAICVADQQKECELENEYANIRHYWSDIIPDEEDSGTVMTATYPKSRDDSGLRVIIHMAVRGHNNAAGYCHHWYLTFDGNKCANPDTIETLDYSATTGDNHRAMNIDGTCYGIEAGDRVVRLVIDSCDGYSSSDGHSGWNSARTMLIMEMVPQKAVTDESLLSCPLLNVFNYKYETWNEEVDQSIDLHAESRLLKEIEYTKVADDTSLRIKYSAVSSVIVTTDGLYYCARWFVKIGDSECSPQLDYVIYKSSPDNYVYWRDHRRVRTLEGICDNSLLAGNHTIGIYIGRCIDSYSQPTRTVTGGFNSPSRLHIEEVRRDHAVDGVISHNQKMFRSHSGNLERFHYWASNKGGDVEDLYTITYVKEYADTALRLTASGVHRIMYKHPEGYSACGRWYFKIDSSECVTPGRIEGVSYFNQYTDYHHPMQVSGMCHGISLGSRTITYAIGYCPGYSHTEAYTGWQSSFHIFVEELRVDLIKTCSSTPMNCDL